MTQEIIVFIILTAVIIYAVYSYVKKLKTKKASACGGCTGCDLKKDLSCITASKDPKAF